MQTEDFYEYFVYDESSPSCLVQKRATYSGNLYVTLVMPDGVPCGYLKDGDWIVTVKQKLVPCAYIVWVLHYGKFEKTLKIQHINGDRSDNRIANLQLTKENA